MLAAASRGYRRPVTRRWTGSWLSGPAAAQPGQAYPGEVLGLPETGAGSVASMGRRVAALLADWLLCVLIALAVVRDGDLARTENWALLFFAAETYLLTALTGVTVGKRLLGIRVTRLDGRPVGFGWSLLRVVLLLAVVPPLISDRDLRGLHDRAANTAVVRL